MYVYIYIYIMSVNHVAIHSTIRMAVEDFKRLILWVFHNYGDSLHTLGFGARIPSGNLTQLWKITIFDGKTGHFQ
jgi:hypothetical protein